MYEINLVSNATISLFINDDDPIRIRPDQIPFQLLDPLAKCTGGSLILSLSIFCDKEWDNYIRVLIVEWDGIIASKHMYKINEDGSYEISKKISEVLA